MADSENTPDSIKLDNLDTYRTAVNNEQQDYDNKQKQGYDLNIILGEALAEVIRLSANPKSAVRALNNIGLLLEKAKREGKTEVTIESVYEALVRGKEV